MTTINNKRRAEMQADMRMQELRIQRFEKAMQEAVPDSDEFKRCAHEIIEAEKWVKYYNLILNGPAAYATEEYARLVAFGESR